MRLDWRRAVSAEPGGLTSKHRVEPGPAMHGPGRVEPSAPPSSGIATRTVYRRLAERFG